MMKMVVGISVYASEMLYQPDVKQRAAQHKKQSGEQQGVTARPSEQEGQRIEQQTETNGNKTDFLFHNARKITEKHTHRANGYQ